MKIERISENQIRCTLNKNDLLERELKISELAYGSEKAKDFFRDMMEQANIDLGFEADDIPLMIEAIPTSRDSIVLVITKVDNPEEFEERFERFGLQQANADSDYEEPDDALNSEELVNCFEQLHDLLEEAEAGLQEAEGSSFIPLSEAIREKQKKKKKNQKKKAETAQDKMRVYSFSSLNPIMQVAKQIPENYSGKNSLWKNEKTGTYYLLMNRGTAKNAFRSSCAILQEYGKEESITYATPYFFAEHYQAIIKDKALKQLAQL